LLANEGKSRRERLTLMRVFEELRGLGYEGGSDSVRRYAKAWRVVRAAVTAQAYVPLSFARGEAYQFDWSHEVGPINRSISAVVILASLKTLGHSPKARLVVTMIEVRS
jgi:hypothetical protein